MADPVTLSIMAATAAANTGFGIAQGMQGAEAQRSAIERQARSRVRAAEHQTQQLQRRAQFERMRLSMNARQVRGRLRVAAGEAGVGMGGSHAMLQRQANAQQELNREIMDRNLADEVRSVFTSTQANIDQMAAGAPSPTMSSISGGLQGLSTGLQIAGAVGDFSSMAQGSSSPNVRNVNPSSIQPGATG